MSSESSADLPQRRSPRWVIWLAVLAVLLLVVYRGVIVPELLRTQKENHSNTCSHTLRLLGTALHSYHITYGTFPPAYIADEEGRPMHSWRVLILPYIGQQALYDQYNFDEPWNGPNNRKLTNDEFWLFQCPSSERGQETNYLAVIDRATAWPGTTGGNVDTIRDKTNETILLVEAVDTGIHWMEPRDLAPEEALQGINAGTEGLHISSKHSQGANILWCDNHTTMLPNDLPDAVLRAYLTTNGGESIPSP